MHRGNPHPPRELSTVFGLSPLAVGTVCCTVAAIGYTIVNICLRKLVVQYDPAWVLCVKESVAVVALAPWQVFHAWRKGPLLPTGRPLYVLVFAGLMTHLVGNLPMLWAMSVVGLALTVPTYLGLNLLTGAILGGVVLRERVTARSATAMALLIASVVLLNFSAGEANAAVAASARSTAGTWWVVLAVAAACLAGVIFGGLGVAVRYSTTGGVALTAVAFLVPAMGSLSLAPLCVWRHGWAILAAMPLHDFGLLVLAGAINLLAFMAIIKGLQLTTVVHANVLSASQVAMAALAGLVFFGEAASPAMLTGVCLTVAGILLIDRPM